MTIAPGQTCPTCDRRVNYPPKEDSPDTTTKSFRLPVDAADEFQKDFARACLNVGITSAHKFAIYKFLDFVIDAILSDEERWAGAYTRSETP